MDDRQKENKRTRGILFYRECCAFCSWTTRQKKAEESLRALFPSLSSNVIARNGRIYLGTFSSSHGILFVIDYLLRRRDEQANVGETTVALSRFRIIAHARIPRPTIRKTLINLMETSFGEKNTLSQIPIGPYCGRVSVRSYSSASE